MNLLINRGTPIVFNNAMPRYSGSTELKNVPMPGLYTESKSSSLVLNISKAIPKPITNITIENEGIDIEVTPMLEKYNLQELRTILTDKKRLDEMYNNLGTVKKQKDKLENYAEIIRNKTITIIDKKNKLKEDVNKYNSSKAEYSNTKKEFDESLKKYETAKEKLKSSTGPKSILIKSMKNVEVNAQSIKNKYKQKLSANPSKVETEIDNFIKEYCGCQRTYNYYDILSESLDK